MLLFLVIAGVTTILGLCGTLMHAMLRLDRSGRASLTDATNTARLARQFRSDVRAAVAAERAGASGLDLTFPGGSSVSYRVDRGWLYRGEESGGEGLALMLEGAYRFATRQSLEAPRDAPAPTGRAAATRPLAGRRRGRKPRP